MNGWIIDAQLGDDGTSIDVWMYVDKIGVQRIIVPWCASIHIHATKTHLINLASWLEYQEISQRFCVGSMRLIRRRLSLDQYEMHEVLEVDLTDSRAIRRLAQHIESRGEFHRHTLYSVDAHLAQRFFVDHNIGPFQHVNWNGHQFTIIDESEEWPQLTQLAMEFCYHSSDGFETIESHLEKVKLTLYSSADSSVIAAAEEISHGASTATFLQQLQSAIVRLNPDIILTQGGDSLHFPMLQKLSEQSATDFSFSRKTSTLKARTMSGVKCVWRQAAPARHSASSRPITHQENGHSDASMS